MLSDAGFKLSHCGTSTTHGILIGVSQSLLKFSHLGLKSTLSVGLGAHMVLLSTEFVSKTGSINHSLLGLLFGVLGLVEHVINLSLHGVNITLKTSLGSTGLAVDSRHVIDSSAGLNKFSLSLPLASLSRVEKGSCFLHLTSKGGSTSLGKVSLLGHLLPDTGGLLIGTLSLSDLALVALDGLLGLIVGLVGVVKSNLQLIDVSLQLLLDSQSLGLGSLFSFKGGLHALHCTLVVLTSVVEFLFLLCHAAINLLPDLTKLKLSSENLIFLSFQCSFSFFQCSLELFLFNLEPSALFVKFLD